MLSQRRNCLLGKGEPRRQGRAIHQASEEHGLDRIRRQLEMIRFRRREVPFIKRHQGKQKQGLPTLHRIRSRSQFFYRGSLTGPAPIPKSLQNQRVAKAGFEPKLEVPGEQRLCARTVSRHPRRIRAFPQRLSAQELDIEIGDILEAHLEQSIKASPSTPTPIRALITSAKASGAYVIGTATLDRELKRVLLKFTKLRLRSGQVYSLIATGLSANGQIGMEGDYHSETGLFLVAEFAAATATGIADASVNRQQNALGNWTQEPSMGNHLKQGAVSALSNTTKRLSETAASAPEWTLTQANQEIKIIIEEVPTEATL